MNVKRPIRLLISTGHTGGHFFPALSFSETLRLLHPEAEIHFLINRITPFMEELLRENSFVVHIIPLNPAPPRFFSFKLVPFLIRCVIALWKTLFLFIKLRPNLVVGFGSYGSAPGVFSAMLFRIPILLHEQNIVMGRANRLFARFATRIAVSFPAQSDQFSNKTFLSGYPLRNSFLNDLSLKSEPSKKLEKPFRILVFGGSQGARRLNEVFISALGLLQAEERRDFAVIHIVGNYGLQEFKATYRTLGIQAELHEFSHKIFEHYKDARLVISRAGAGTIFELAAVGRAAILIPYPHAFAHQKFNAEYLAQKNAAAVIEENKLTPQILLDEILNLKQNQSRRHEFEENMRTLFKPGANQILAETSWELICKKN